MLGENKALDYFLGSYRDFVTLPSAIASYRTLFTDLAAHDNLPALVHCTTGKDRTGWATASLLLLLGLDEDAVFHEYLLTNEQLVPKLQPMVDKFAANGGDPDLLAPVLGVQTSYLDAAIDEMQKRFGSIDGYFADGLGLDAATIEALRSSYIQAD